MFASVKRTLGIVDVSSTAKYVSIEGIDTFTFLRDCYRVWGSNSVGNQMFSVIQSGKLRFLHFFALDFKYILEKLLDDPQTRSSRRVLAKVLHELKEKTWIGDIDREVKSITSEKDIDHLAPFPLKPFQKEFVRHFGKLVPAYRLRGYMLDAGAGTGKAQPLSSKVRVPGGWKKMGDIQVGDEVIGRNGKPTKVTGVYPQGVKDIYKVTFADGRVARCCLDHLWSASAGNEEEQVFTTADIIELLNKHTGVSIPLIEPEEGTDTDFHTNRYSLGQNADSTPIMTEHLEGSIVSRMAIVRGMLDKAGYVHDEGYVTYRAANAEQAETFKYLIRSLGGIAKSAVADRFASSQLTIAVWHKDLAKLFTRQDQIDRATEVAHHCANLRLRIETIEADGQEEAQCLMVENEEHLYVTDGFVVTHNTVTQLVLAHCLGANKVILVVPKNSAERVWRDTITGIMLQKKPYWLSTDNKPLNTDAFYYIVHYEQLQQVLEFVKAHPREFEKTYLGLDESHNFNRIASDRTQAFIDLAEMPQIMTNLWASGTPIQALGIECIPFLKCIDPMFNDEAEERFRKIYGRDAKRANDILRNRIGHLKYHVPKQDVVDIPVHTQTVLVKMPNANEYTLEAIGEKMRKFINERTAFYEKHKAEFRNDYDRALTYFEQHAHFNKADYAAYKAAVALISKGFDPKLMKAEAQLANGFERKIIIPALPNAMKEDFRKAKSVVKYVNLTIMGEALGGVLGKMRSKCHLEMVEQIDFTTLIDGAQKKTLIFTSFVEVLVRASELIDQRGYRSARVYGATNKDLSKIVKEFYENEDINPLLATYPSLSTAVPLTAASRILMINQPFRDAIRTQTIARAARLGQDTAVDVVDLLLDTGDRPNISTRSNDILQWSAEMVGSILGVTNVDLDNMQLE